MKFFAHLIGYSVTFGLSCLVMIYGWGIQPVHWGWIIWGNIGAVIVGAGLAMLGED